MIASNTCIDGICHKSSDSIKISHDPFPVWLNDQDGLIIQTQNPKAAKTGIIFTKKSAENLFILGS
ncbi:MAG: hypothetical protein LBI92_10410 [Azoarcus sp.]|jgi:hypothetical protein|nr:hypothetical protein [Azoarcus sp.]